MITNQPTTKKKFMDYFMQFFGTRTYLKFFLVFAILAAAGTFVWRLADSRAQGASAEVNWRLLGDLDYITGKGTKELEALDGQAVRIPGFMVPLEDNMRSVSEFLLVPSPQACIHVPPPPPNQMVYVKMQERGTEAAYGPIWVYGTLHLKVQKHMYGEASFTLSGLKTTPYR